MSRKSFLIRSNAKQRVELGPLKGREGRKVHMPELEIDGFGDCVPVMLLAGDDIAMDMGQEILDMLLERTTDVEHIARYIIG